MYSHFTWSVFSQIDIHLKMYMSWSLYLSVKRLTPEGLNHNRNFFCFSTTMQRNSRNGKDLKQCLHVNNSNRYGFHLHIYFSCSSICNWGCIYARMFIQVRQPKFSEWVELSVHITISSLQFSVNRWKWPTISTPNRAMYIIRNH